MFTEDGKANIAKLMHAYGDVETPRRDTVDVMCGMLVEFLEDSLHRAVEIACLKGKFDAECLLFVCKDDKRMFKVAKCKMERNIALGAELGKK